MRAWSQGSEPLDRNHAAILGARRRRGRAGCTRQASRRAAGRELSEGTGGLLRAVPLYLMRCSADQEVGGRFRILSVTSCRFISRPYPCVLNSPPEITPRRSSEESGPRC